MAHYAGKVITFWRLLDLRNVEQAIRMLMMAPYKYAALLSDEHSLHVTS